MHLLASTITVDFNDNNLAGCLNPIWLHRPAVSFHCLDEDDYCLAEILSS